MKNDLDYIQSDWSMAELSAALDKTPLGTVSLLFGRVPVLQVPPAWRGVRVELHQEVEIHSDGNGSVAVAAEMRSGFRARLFGSKIRVMGALPPHIAEVLVLKRAEGAILRARIVDVPQPRLRAGHGEMGFYVSIRCRS